jgi:hypothetical protein
MWIVVLYIIGEIMSLQRGLASVDSWCGHWIIEINEDKTQTVCFSHGRRQVEDFLALKGG